MSQTFQNLSILHPDYLLPIALKQLQGEFVGKYFFPDRPVTNFTYRWRYYGVVGGMTPEVGENDKGPLNHTRYEQRVGRVHIYKERDLISDYTDYVEARNIVRDSIQNLTERFALRQEYLRVNAIVNACFANTSIYAGTKGYFWQDNNDDGSNWEGGSGPSDPLKQIIVASKHIKKYAKVQTDTIIGSPDVIQALKTNTGLKQWDRSGPLVMRLYKENELIESAVPGSAGRIAGHEVFEVNASILSDQSNVESNLSPLLDKDVYIFKRGEALGALHVLKGLFTRTKKKLMRDATELQVGGIMYPDVFRPQFIYGIKNAIA